MAFDILRRIAAVLFPGLLDQPVVQFEAAIVVLAILAGRYRPHSLRWADRLLRRLSARPAAAFAGCTVLALLLHAAVAPLLTRRAPLLHDEFSYILSADTFLAGRAANPPHPAWRSLETPYVLFSPRYASMYFPAPGLLLAAGKWLCGDYLAGPWLAAALLAALAGWMLAAWVPRRWALWGAVLVALRFGVFGYWANSFWGGNVPAAGGLLVWGAVPRLLRDMRAPHGATAAAGLVLLAASRPFEGALAAIACGLACVPLVARRRVPWRALLPGAAVLLAGIAAILLYNARVTGNPLAAPQSVYMRQYGLAIFPWQAAASTPALTNPPLVRFYDTLHDSFRAYRTIPGFLASRLVASGRLWAFFLGPLLTLPFLAVPALLRDRRRCWIFFAALLCLAGLAVTPNFLPHYAAPAFGLLLLTLVEAARILCAAWGRLAFALRALPLLCAAVVLFRLVVPPRPTLFDFHWFYTPPGNQERAAVSDRLEREHGRHVVLVRYAPGHYVYDEWVYNAARIDEAKTIWAHDLDPPTNKCLLAYFPGRRLWLLEPDARPPRLSECTASEVR